MIANAKYELIISRLFSVHTLCKLKNEGNNMEYTFQSYLFKYICSNA